MSVTMGLLRKKGFMFIIIILILLAAHSLADTYAPDYYQYRVVYSSGDEAQPWTTQCDTNSSNPNDDWNGLPLGPMSCSVTDLGDESDPVFCAEEGTVKIQWQMYHEPDSGLPNDFTQTSWKDMYSIDWDADVNDCDCLVGAGRYNVGGEISQCCGDDANETYLSESMSALHDALDSDACCDNIDDCVDDDQCYSDSEFHNIGEPDERGLPVTGDEELCQNNAWRDADEDKARCDDFKSIINKCHNGADNSCWVPEGEPAGSFGGYAAGDNEQGCCGDDSGEYYIMTDHFNDACCNMPDDFVFSKGDCKPASSRRYLYGRVWGGEPNGSYAPLGRVLVQAVDPYDASIINENITDSQGFYNISVIPGIYDLAFRPPEVYKGATFRIEVGTEHVQKDYYADLLSSCRHDCTSYNADDKEYYCDKDCDGINGCEFNQSVVSNSSIYPPGSTMKDLCDQLKPGWKLEHNSTFDILCCNGGYTIKPEYVNASLDLSGNYKHIESFYGGLVSYYGKFVSIWVAIGEE